ncbi:hypothetical protein [Novosphingobium lentum]|uniref:hypothetical protein n=1 Tax=Novosphingobium lentum TaxID=145287 RepID=UPI0008327257|nr:hypothetical protein [Novosphingobium lentum]
MSFLLYARLAQFPIASSEDWDVAEKTCAAAGLNSNGADHFATVQWSVDEGLGIPEYPFDVELLVDPLPAETCSRALDSDIDLDLMSPEYGLFKLLAPLGRADALCVLAMLDGDAETEVYAIDAEGREIPQSRREARPARGTAWIGPGICGLRATGASRLRSLRAFALPPTGDTQFELVATVAAAIDVPNYGDLFYRGGRYSWDQALDIRLAVDAYARWGTNPPASALLEKVVHRGDPNTLAGRFLSERFATEIGAKFSSILNDPDWAYTETVQPGLDSEVRPAQMLQAMAMTGPVAATTAGHAVTVPIFHPFRLVTSPEDLFNSTAKMQALPYPIARVRSHHLMMGQKVVSECLTCLAFAAPAPTAMLQTARSYPPEGRDLPASADLQVRLDSASGGLAAFADLGDGTDDFKLDEWNEPANLWGDGSPDDQTESGLPVRPLGRVALPLEALVVKAVRLFGRDIFGRWCPPIGASGTLDPIPVQKPQWESIDIEYHGDGTIGLRAVLGWDWTVRSPDRFRIGLGVAPHQETALKADPGDGVVLPGESPVPLEIVFNGDTPSVGSGAPSTWSISALPAYAAPDPSEPAMPTEYRHYALRLNLGLVGRFFAAAASVRVALAADALERVSGHSPERRSAPDHIQSVVSDPRPPALSGSLWRLEWASRANGSGRALAYVDPTQLTAGPAKGWYIWRAHESALSDLGLRATFADENTAAAYAEVLRNERDPALRLVMIQGLIEPHLHRATFKRAFVDAFEANEAVLLEGPGEVQISGAQGGLEFLMVTAVSVANIESAKIDLADLRAIAVPYEVKRDRPVLRAFRAMGDGPYARAGLVALAVGTTEPVSPTDIRLFWDDQAGVAGEDELLHQLGPVAELSAGQLELFMPGAQAVLDRMHVPAWRLFAVRPRPSWSTHMFSADLCAVRPRNPSEAIASPRAVAQNLTIAPPAGPKIEIEDDKESGNTRHLVLRAEGLFETLLPGFAPCQIQFSLVDDPADDTVTSPMPIAEFVASGATVEDGVARFEASMKPNSNRIEISGPPRVGKFLRIVASDPAGRFEVGHIEV